MALGQKTAYPNTYDSELLHAVPRFRQREAMGFPDNSLFFGADVWNLYELSFHNMKGKPVRALATLVVPCNSPFIVESKSMKLYLNSINKTRFASVQEVKELIERDVSKVCQSNVQFDVLNEKSAVFFSSHDSGFYCLDELDVEVQHYQRNPDLLMLDDANIVQEKVVTHLFKSHCLVTRQPDWASIFIEYRGPKIARESLLAYLISFHDHVGFSENCIEQIFVDILQRARPQTLTINGRFTRRGGIDINPLRSTSSIETHNWRVFYQ